MIRILLADDHLLIRQGVRRLLEMERDIQVVGEASDGLEVQRQALSLKPDLILMDVAMPIVDGIGATREIIRAWPEAKIVILTMHSQEGHLFQALQAGAIGYALKTSGADQLVAAVRAAAGGGATIPPLLASKVLGEFRRMAAKVGARDEMGQLTDADVQLLKLVAAGLSNKEIAARLNFAESTVKNRLSVLFQKIGVADRTQAAIYAISSGVAPAELLSRAPAGFSR